jgi:MoaA/NifB/PqqE/SkfB family radical SAM enzyme
MCDRHIQARCHTPCCPRASYELNLSCNYDCPMCYLGVKRFSGLGWDDRVKLLHAIADAGVLFLQLTGGEPLMTSSFPTSTRWPGTWA